MRGTENITVTIFYFYFFNIQTKQTKQQTVKEELPKKKKTKILASIIVYSLSIIPFPTNII